MPDLVAAGRARVEFVSPEYLAFLVAAAALLLAALGVWMLRLSGRPPRTAGSTYSPGGSQMVWLLAIVLLATSAAAAAGPLLVSGQSTFTRNAVELVIVVDVSASMWVEDLRPSRLDVARREVLGLRDDDILKEGDRAALFVFATTAIRKAHRSADIQRTLQVAGNLRRPEALTGDAFPWSSDIASALEHVYQSLDGEDRLRAGDENWQPVKRTDQLVLLLSDGDFEIDGEQSQRLDAALVEFHRRGLPIYPIGIATEQGAPVRDILRRYDARGGYDPALAADLEDQHSRVNRATLSYIARRSGGKEFIVSDPALRASDFLREAVDARRGVGFQLVASGAREEAWPYLVCAGLAAFAIGWGAITIRRLIGGR